MRATEANESSDGELDALEATTPNGRAIPKDDGESEQFKERKSTLRTNPSKSSDDSVRKSVLVRDVASPGDSLEPVRAS